MGTRKRISKKELVSNCPDWTKKLISQYHDAHTASADDIVQRYIADNVKFLNPKKKKQIIRDFITRNWKHNISVCKALKEKYCKPSIFNPIKL